MKTLYLFPLLFSLWLVSCKKEEIPTPPDTDTAKPKGTHLQRMTVYMIPFVYGEPSPLRKIEWGYETYTPEGLMASKRFRPDYSLDLAYNNPRIEQNTYEKGVLRQKVEMNRGAYRKNVYTYTNNLLTLREAFNDPEGTGGPLEKYTYEYAGGDKPSKMHSFWGSFNGDPLSGDTLNTHAYTYDSRGNLLTERTIFGPGNEVAYYFEYDHHNNITKKSFASSEKPTPVVLQILEYRYDSEGRISEREHSTLGELNFQKYVYHYDKEDRISYIDVYEENRLQKREYEQKAVFAYTYTYN